MKFHLFHLMTFIFAQIICFKMCWFSFEMQMNLFYSIQLSFQVNCHPNKKKIDKEKMQSRRMRNDNDINTSSMQKKLCVKNIWTKNDKMTWNICHKLLRQCTFLSSLQRVGFILTAECDHFVSLRFNQGGKNGLILNLN